MDLSEYITPGYLVCIPLDRPNYFKSRLPAKILSASQCICSIAPQAWMSGWECSEIQEDEMSRQIDVNKAVSLVAWLEEVFQAETPTFFPTLESARQFVEEYCALPEACILGIALHPSLLNMVRLQAQEDCNNGSGLLEKLEPEHSIEHRNAEVLGYELLGYYAMGFHSWICHDLPNELEKECGVYLNEHGFIPTWEDALKSHQYIAPPDSGREPGIWAPWLIVRYPSQ